MTPRLTCLAAAILLSSPAHAADETKEMGMTLGQAIVVGTQSEKLADSPALTLYYIKRIGRMISAGVEMGQAFGHTYRGHFSENDLGDVDNPPDGRADNAAFTSGAKVTTFWLSPIVKIGKKDEDSVDNLRPYGILGVGYYQTKNKGGSAKLFGKSSAGADLSSTNFPIKKTEENNLGMSVGGGFILRLSGRFELAGDMRYHYIFSHNDSLNYFMPSARFNFIFGR